VAVEARQRGGGSQSSPARERQPELASRCSRLLAAAGRGGHQYRGEHLLAPRGRERDHVAGHPHRGRRGGRSPARGACRWAAVTPSISLPSSSSRHLRPARLTSHKKALRPESRSRARRPWRQRRRTSTAREVAVLDNAPALAPRGIHSTLSGRGGLNRGLTPHIASLRTAPSCHRFLWRRWRNSAMAPPRDSS
jgi:hypothetical protein